jgi:TctA family transporter
MTRVARGLNLFSAVVGIIAVVMIIVGGIQYITSGGDSGNVTKAKNTILYAVIGLVVVALAQIIVKFVLGRFTGNGHRRVRFSSYDLDKRLSKKSSRGSSFYMS